MNGFSERLRNAGFVKNFSYGDLLTHQKVMIENLEDYLTNELRHQTADITKNPNFQNEILKAVKKVIKLS